MALSWTSRRLIYPPSYPSPNPIDAECLVDSNGPGRQGSHSHIPWPRSGPQLQHLALDYWIPEGTIRGRCKYIFNRSSTYTHGREPVADNNGPRRPGSHFYIPRPTSGLQVATPCIDLPYFPKLVSWLHHAIMQSRQRKHIYAEWYCE